MNSYVTISEALLAEWDAKTLRSAADILGKRSTKPGGLMLSVLQKVLRNAADNIERR